MLDTGIEAARLLREHGFDAGVTAINVVKPMDAAAVNSETKLVVTLEDNTIIGGFSDEFDRVNREKAFGILNFALPDQFIEQGSIPNCEKNVQ